MNFIFQIPGSESVAALNEVYRVKWGSYGHTGYLQTFRLHTKHTLHSVTFIERMHNL